MRKEKKKILVNIFFQKGKIILVLKLEKISTFEHIEHDLKNKILSNSRELVLKAVISL